MCWKMRWFMMGPEERMPDGRSVLRDIGKVRIFDGGETGGSSSYWKARQNSSSTPKVIGVDILSVFYTEFICIKKVSFLNEGN